MPAPQHSARGAEALLSARRLVARSDVPSWILTFARQHERRLVAWVERWLKRSPNLPKRRLNVLASTTA